MDFNLEDRFRRYLDAMRRDLFVIEARKVIERVVERTSIICEAHVGAVVNLSELDRRIEGTISILRLS